MKKRFKNLLKHGALVGLACTTIVGAGYTFAAPTTAPSAGTGVYLPLNVGPDAQVKTGALTVNGALTAGSLSVPSLCLNGDCQSSWPSGGGVQSVSVSGGAFPSPTYCYANIYESITYYQYGSGPYSQTAYVCATTQFSVNIPNAVPNGSNVVSTASLTVWCHGGYSDYSYAGTTYLNDSYYPHKVQASNVGAVANGTTLQLQVTCPFYNGGSYVIYKGVTVTGSMLVS